jgi:cytochrome c oxidase subunit 4
MAERVLAPRTYIMVYAALVGFTMLTIGCSFLPLHLLYHDVIGLAIGVCKATLVVLIFMHLLFSPRVTWIVVAVAVFWLGILLVLTLTDYFSRGMVPRMPGH